MSHSAVRPKVASIMRRFAPKDVREAKAGMTQDDCDEIKEELEDVKDENNTLEERGDRGSAKQSRGNRATNSHRGTRKDAHGNQVGRYSTGNAADENRVGE